MRLVASALRQGEARHPSWTGWSKLLRDAEQAKIADHPLRTPEGHHVLNAEFFPLVFSAFGSMGPGVFALIKRVRSERGIQAALGLT